MSVQKRLAILPDLAAGGLAAALVLVVLPGFEGRVLPAATTALVYLAVAAAIVWAWPADRANFGWPNRVTLLRAALVAAIAGRLAAPFSSPDDGLVIFAVAALALALDGLDGWLARALGRATDFGACFDMEVDALLILVLCVAVWLTGKVGPWVLAIGLMRYAFVAAGCFLPALTQPLAPSLVRKVVCVVQGAVLAVCLLPAVPPSWTRIALGLALLALAASFARDTLDLLTRPPAEGDQR